MVFFKNATIYTTKKTTVRNAIGQLISTYMKDKELNVNIQPITEESKSKDWGTDINAQYNMYSDELLSVGDLVSYNNKSYTIVKAIYWNTYSIYALSEADVEVSE